MEAYGSLPLENRMSQNRPAAKTPIPPRPTGLRPWVARHQGALFVGLLIGLLLYVQWPMFKGVIYRAVGTEPADKIAWRTDLAQAMVEAKAAGKPLLVDFTASWCPPCQVMKVDVWPDDQVAALAAGKYVPVLIDVDRQGDLAGRYDITTIPAILVLDASGQVLHRGSYMSSGQMVKFLNQHAAGG